MRRPAASAAQTNQADDAAQADQADELARALIEHHEGRRTHPYRDTTGHLTIGVGRNLDGRGLSEAEIDLLFAHDLDMAVAALAAFLPGWSAPTPLVRAALLSMAFNLGQTRLSGFEKMRTSLLAGDFSAAADEALASRWAVQTGRRAQEVADILRRAAQAARPAAPNLTEKKEM